MNFLTKQRDSQTYKTNLQLLGGKGIVREIGIDVFTLLYLKLITNKDLLYSTRNSVQCYVAGWMAGKFWEHGYTYMYEGVPSLFT